MARDVFVVAPELWSCDFGGAAMGGASRIGHKYDQSVILSSYVFSAVVILSGSWTSGDNLSTTCFSTFLGIGFLIKIVSSTSWLFLES